MANINSPKLFFMSKSQTFTKDERLCRQRVIQKLFSSGISFFEYPFKVIFIDVDKNELIQGKYNAQCLFSVSKRIFKRAVQRNHVKRLMREAYRKNKFLLYEKLESEERKIALAIIFTGKIIPEYAWLEVKIINIIKRLTQELNSKRLITK